MEKGQTTTTICKLVEQSISSKLHDMLIYDLSNFD
jgi:hypothetical protein